MTLALGAEVACLDGELGELADVVLDPDSGRVTHLVVQPERHELLSPRLVPAALAFQAAGGTGLELGCTLREFDAMDPVRQLAPVPLGPPRVDDPDWDVGKVDVVAPAVPMPVDAGATSYLIQSTMAYDRVPKYEIELGRTSPVRSSDGHHLGHVVALTVDGAGMLTGLVLERHRLWRRTQVSVPVGEVAEMGMDLVTLRLSKREAGRLRTSA